MSLEAQLDTFRCEYEANAEPHAANAVRRSIRALAEVASGKLFGKCEKGPRISMGDKEVFFVRSHKPVGCTSQNQAPGPTVGPLT